jgi:hypothetical protein
MRQRRAVTALVVLAMSAWLGAQEPSTSSTAGSLDAAVSLVTPEAGSATFTLTGTWSATANFERTGDGGTTWSSIPCVTAATGALVTATTANGTFVCAAGGAQRIRARLNPYTSGTATVAIYAGHGATTMELARALPSGTNVIGHIVADSGSTTAVTGNVTVTQATAANLKVDLSGTAANATAVKVDGSAVTQPISDAKLPATQALSDTLSNPTVTGIGAYLLGWDSGAGQWRRAAINGGLFKVDASGATVPVSFSGFNVSTSSSLLQSGATANGNGSVLNQAGAQSAARDGRVQRVLLWRHDGQLRSQPG